MHEESDDHVGRHKMEYTTPASKTALRTIEAMPAVSRMESCQSCFGSNAMLHGWRQQSGDIDLDHGGCRRASDLPVHPGKCHQQRCCPHSPWREAIDSGPRIPLTAQRLALSGIQNGHRELFSNTVVKKKLQATP